MSVSHTLFFCYGGETLMDKLQTAATKKTGVLFGGNHVANLAGFTKTGNQIHAQLQFLDTLCGGRAFQVCKDGYASFYAHMGSDTYIEHGKMVERCNSTWLIVYSERMHHRNVLLALCRFEWLAQKDGDHAVGENIKSFLL